MMISIALCRWILLASWMTGRVNGFLVRTTSRYSSFSLLLSTDNQESPSSPPQLGDPAPIATENSPPTPQPPYQPTARDLMNAMGTSPRRIALSALSGAGIALAGNLFGVTSMLLQNIDEDVVASTGLDTYFPRGDFKRVRTPAYTYVIPKQWVADTALELAKAQRQVQPLDYNAQQRRTAARSVLPDTGKWSRVIG